MSCCNTQINARRNADFRFTYGPSSRKFTFSGMVPRFSVRRGETELLVVTDAATINGSSFVVVGDDIVLTVTKEDLALLDSATPDTQSEDLFYDITLTDGSGFENWLLGNAFILLGLNDDSSCNCNGTAEVSLGGQCVEISIEGGNLAAGMSVSAAELNEAVNKAEQAAEDAEAAAQAAASVGASSGAAAGAAAGSTAGASAGSASGATAGTAAANTVVAGKANIDASNVTDGVAWRSAIGAVSSTELQSSDGAGLVGVSHSETYSPSTLGSRFKTEIHVRDHPFNGDLQAAVNECSARGGGIVRLDATVTIAASTTITIPRNVSIYGVVANADPGNPDFAGRVGGYAGMAAMPKVIIPSTSKIQPMGTQVFQGVCFARLGLAFDGNDEATNYAGTAVEIGATDAVQFNNCSFLGFSQAIKATGTADWIAQGCLFDCNNGVWQETSFDKTHLWRNRFYGVLQSGVNGNDPRTQRDGYAMRFTGTSNGGPSLISNFAYGYRYSFWFDTGGHYGCVDNWADGPQNATNGLPLWSDSVGCYVGSAGSANAEVNLTGFKICAHAENLKIGAGNYGTTFVIGHHNWGAFNAIVIGGTDITIIGGAVRSYYGTGILFQNAAAANSAKIIGLSFYDSATSPFSPVEIDNGGGEPISFGVTRNDGIIRVNGTVPVSAARDGTGLVVAPEGRDQFVITGTGGIGDIQPRIPGKVITITLSGGGLSLTGGNFKLVSAFSGADGSSISMRCSNDGSQWVEQSRAVF